MRVFTIAAFSIALLSLTATAAETMTAPTLTPDNTLQTTLNQIAARLNSIESRLDRADAAQSATATTDVIGRTEFETRMSEMDARWNDLSGHILAQHNDLREVVSRDSRNVATLRLRSMMEKSPEFRTDFSSAVRQAMPEVPQWGVVRVENNMSTDQTLHVNGEPWSVPAMQRRDVSVPVGTVTTQLVGYESPKTWVVGSPTFMQRVSINPIPAPTIVHSPIVSQQPTVVQQPTIVQSPIITPTVVHSPVITPTVVHSPVVASPTVVYSPAVAPTVTYSPIPAPTVVHSPVYTPVVAPPVYSPVVAQPVLVPVRRTFRPFWARW